MFTKLGWNGNKKDDEEEYISLENTDEIIAHILKSLPIESGPQSYDWQCSVTDEHLHDSYVKSCNKWSDAAYQGDWDKIFKIAAKEPNSLGRYADVTRLHRPPIDASRPPSGYTVLHQAAYHNAPVKVVKALITFGCRRQLHSTDGKFQRPVDIAREKGFTELVPILEPPPDLLPHITPEALSKIQAHFQKVVLVEARGIFKLESMKVADLSLLREVQSIWMAVPGMYGGFQLRFEGDHLVTESACRVVGGSGRTNHITAEGAILVEEGWG